MMTTTEILLNNPNMSDEILAVITRKALEENNEQILRGLAMHKNAGPKTLSLIVNHHSS